MPDLVLPNVIGFHMYMSLWCLFEREGKVNFSLFFLVIRYDRKCLRGVWGLAGGNGDVILHWGGWGGGVALVL